MGDIDLPIAQLIKIEIAGVGKQVWERLSDIGFQPVVGQQEQQYEQVVNREDAQGSPPVKIKQEPPHGSSILLQGGAILQQFIGDQEPAEGKETKYPHTTQPGVGPILNEVIFGEPMTDDDQ